MRLRNVVLVFVAVGAVGAAGLASCSSSSASGPSGASPDADAAADGGPANLGRGDGGGAPLGDAGPPPPGDGGGASLDAAPKTPPGAYDAGVVAPAACGGAVHCVGAGGSIQAAIDAARDGDIIQVAGGTFREDLSVANKSLTLAGGFDATFNARDTRAYETVVQGSGAQSVVRIVADGKANRIDGFTLTGGAGDPGAAYSGAGLFAQNGNVTVYGNHIHDNVVAAANIHMTDTRGGGVLASGYGATTFTIVDNVIENNASGRGAGIASVGASQLVIQGNVVKNNRGYSDHGGGLFIMSRNATLRANLVVGNEIGPLVNPYGWGGGIFVNENGSFAALSYNVVTGNKAPSDGSGIFFNNGAKGTLDHEIYYANACPRDTGAAILVEATDPTTPGSITVTQSTVVNHPCTTPYNGNGIMLGSPGCRADVSRSIFTNNGPTQFGHAQGAEIPPTVADSFIDQDPQFVDAPNGDFHLKPGSPATGYGAL